MSAEPAGTAVHRRAVGLWTAIAAALVVLVFLIVFLLQNGQHVRVSYLGAHGHLPLGVALLLAAVVGGLVVVLALSARILALRRRARRGGAKKLWTRRRRQHEPQR